jgi:hypothetical protein
MYVPRPVDCDSKVSELQIYAVEQLSCTPIGSFKWIKVESIIM